MSTKLIHSARSVVQPYPGDSVPNAHLIRESKPRIKCQFVGAKEDKPHFKEATCVLPISIGQPYHEGNHFIATIQLINQHFRACVIMICDALQRHTLSERPHLSEQGAYTQAMRLGEAWQVRNSSIYRQLTIPYQIQRWDDWLNSRAYSVQRETTDKLYLSHKEFYGAIHESVQSFLTRRQQCGDLDAVHYDQMYQRCIEYLKEECSVSPLWAQLGIDYEVYPSKGNAAMKFIYDHVVQPRYDGLLKRVRINFRSIHKTLQ